MHCFHFGFKRWKKFVAAQQNRLTIDFGGVEFDLCSAAKRRIPGIAQRHLDLRIPKARTKQHFTPNHEPSSISLQTSKSVDGPSCTHCNGTNIESRARGARLLAADRQDNLSTSLFKGKTMFNTPEQLIAAHKAALETM